MCAACPWDRHCSDSESAWRLSSRSRVPATGRLTFLPGDVIERVERIGVFAPVRRLRQQLPKPANT
jgi:hypothetical protein